MNLYFVTCFHCHSRTKVEFSAGGEFFHCAGQHVIAKGFTSVMPWMSLNEKNLPQFSLGEKIKFSKVELYEVAFQTSGSFFLVLMYQAKLTSNS